MIVVTNIEITGVVQGVGFRPFIFQLACRYGITGSVSNSLRGVIISAVGAEAAVAEFVDAITRERPPLARIYSINVGTMLTPLKYDDFQIEESSGEGDVTVAITPDAASCAECLSEVRDPGDRRYRYLLTTCTNCGPRYSVIKGLPFDRAQTTLEKFPLCVTCMDEYQNPRSRRFHAQAVNCPNCGPHVSLFITDGLTLTGDDAVSSARKRLRRGEIGLIKSLGGYHLVADPASEKAIQAIRDMKERGNKPLALMAASLDVVKSIASPTIHEALLLESVERPIVCVRGKQSKLQYLVAQGLAHLGVMLSPTPLHASLLTDGLSLIVATSANAKGETIVYDDKEALTFLSRQQMSQPADFVLAHNRPIHVGVDDSVLRHMASRKRDNCGDALAAAERGATFIRRARGYSPTTHMMQSAVRTKPILALGSDMKNTISFVSNAGCITTSPHLGSLGIASADIFHQKTTSHLKSLLQISAETVAHDLHPEFRVTKLAKEIAKQTGATAVGIQHHHAHFAACLAENEITQDAVGIILDGFGFGEDGSYWGGEILVGNSASSERVKGLSKVPLIGSDLSAKRCDYTALSFLLCCFENLTQKHHSILFPAMSAFEMGRVFDWLRSPLAKQRDLQSSSAGRLLDAIAHIVGVCSTNTYEGEAPMKLEALALSETNAFFQELSVSTASSETIDWRPLIKAAVEQRMNGRNPAWIARASLNAISDLFCDAAIEAARSVDCSVIALSGGVFINEIITERVIEKIKNAGLTSAVHSKFPPGDGCISFGQAVTIAARQVERG